MTLTLFVLSIIGGFLSGLLGVGGAVILIPLLLTVPPLTGAGTLDMKQVAGISIVQVLAASLAGFFAHSKGGTVNRDSLMAIGVPMGVCSLIGATLSKSMPSQAMLIIFGVLVIVALLLLIFKSDQNTAEGEGHENPSADDSAVTTESEFKLNIPLAVAVGSSVGVLAGIVGAGGGFILIPLMIVVLGMPVRMAVGSSLGIVFIGALSGSVGKLMTAQVEWAFVWPVLLGCIPASQVGAKVSQSAEPKTLKYLLIALITLTMIKIWLQIFGVELLPSA